MLLRLNSRTRGPVRTAGMLWLAIGASHGCAVEAGDNTEIHGFLSQAYINTEGNNYFGESRNGSLDFREAGINVFHQALPDLNLAAQVISRKAGRTDDGEPRLDYALMDYTVLKQDGWRSGIRLGRIKTPYGFYNLTRDIPNARPGIFVPPSIYFEQLRNTLVSADGGNLYGDLYQDWGSLSVNIYSGATRTDVEMEYFIVQQPLPGKFDDARIHGAQLLYESPGGRVNLAVSYAHPDIGYSPAAGDLFAAGNVQSDARLYSVRYNRETWSLSGEFLTMHNTITGLVALPDRNSNSEAFYLQGDYRVTPQITAYLRYEEQTLDTADRDGTKFYQPLFGAAHIAFAKSWVVGGRWNFAPQWRLGAEFHNTRGTVWLPKSDNPVLADREDKWKMLAIQLIYSF